MAISFQRYVSITSGVGGNSPVAQRQLIGRLFTTNPLLPTQSFIEFDNADDVGTYFGTASTEYKRAAFYFSFISKTITSPPKISFARWADVATAALMYGGAADTTLADWTAITNGDFTITLGGVALHVSGLNFSSAGSLAGVASVVQSAIRTGTGSQFTAATVTFDSVRQSFDFVGGATGAAAIVVTPGTVNDISAKLGWTTMGVILSNGVAAETLTTTLINSAGASNNFGSFEFIGGSQFTPTQHLEIATWNATQKTKFIYCVTVTAANAAAVNAALINIPGNAMTLQGASGQYHAMCPMAILAATDYTRRASTQNYEFQQFPALTPTVATDANADTYDALRVNYYGVTQTAGQMIAFYQKGVLTGTAVDPLDINTYANEMWLKDAIGSQIMSLLLTLSKVSANKTGRSQLIAIIMSIVTQALFNGTISVRKTLNTNQQLYISQITGSDTAWRQVQTSGYWLDCVITSTVVSGVTQYKAVYTLVYSKDDVIRKVEGSDILI